MGENPNTVYNVGALGVERVKEVEKMTISEKHKTAELAKKTPEKKKK